MLVSVVPPETQIYSERKSVVTAWGKKSKLNLHMIRIVVANEDGHATEKIGRRLEDITREAERNERVRKMNVPLLLARENSKERMKERELVKS